MMFIEQRCTEKHKKYGGDQAKLVPFSIRGRGKPPQSNDTYRRKDHDYQRRDNRQIHNVQEPVRLYLLSHSRNFSSVRNSTPGK